MSKRLEVNILGCLTREAKINLAVEVLLFYRMGQIPQAAHCSSVRRVTMR